MHLSGRKKTQWAVFLAACLLFLGGGKLLMVWEESGFFARIPPYSNSQVQWTRVNAWMQDKKAVPLHVVPDPEVLAAIRAIVRPAGVSRETLLKNVMRFVHDNSIHKIDAEHHTYAFKTDAVLSMLLAVQRGESGHKPHLSCGSRSYAMKGILDDLGISSRLVQIFSRDYKRMEGHRFLEVYDPESAAWEAWDPDFNVTYVDAQSGAPVDVLSLLFAKPGRVVPVRGDVKGWNETGTAHLREHFLQAVLFEALTLDGRRQFLLVAQKNRFPPDTVFTGGETTQQWFDQRFGNPVTLRF